MSIIFYKKYITKTWSMTPYFTSLDSQL
jgi:hypothetical protein